MGDVFLLALAPRRLRNRVGVRTVANDIGDGVAETRPYVLDPTTAARIASIKVAAISTKSCIASSETNCLLVRGVRSRRGAIQGAPNEADGDTAMTCRDAAFARLALGVM
jgi:hypothetical protein